jgi:sorting nexin-27
LTSDFKLLYKQEAEKLEPEDESFAFTYYDYSDKRSLPISIPDYNYVDKAGERFVVFNIYVAGRHLCSRRYREFGCLHYNLRKEFPDFQFPKMPGKWPFTLTDQQQDTRRRGLERYLEKVCAVRVIAESDVMQDFLTDCDNASTSTALVDLKILLPGKTVTVVSVRKNATSVEVFRAVSEKMILSNEIASCFALFEVVEYGFERKLQPAELPYNLYIQNYSTDSSTCLAVRKWLFSTWKEEEISKIDHLAESYFFWQAIDDINKGSVKPENHLYELKAFQDCTKRNEYLSLVRTLNGYNEICFPHCACDARKEGHVIAIVSLDALKLQACREDGFLEQQLICFDWNTISEWDIDEKGVCFIYIFVKDKKPRSIRIHTPFYVYMKDCFDRIALERKWNRPLPVES